MRKNKIIIFPGYYVPHIGGLETHVDELAKYLSKIDKYSITIFAPNIPKFKSKEIKHNNVKIIRYPAFEIVSNYPFPKFWNKQFWKLFLNLYKTKFDIVMTRTRFFSNSFLGLIFAKIRIKKIKLIHGEHGSSFIKVENNITNSISYVYDQIFSRLLFKLSDRVISVSKTSKKFVEKNFLSKGKVEVITRGVDFEQYKNLEDLKEIKQQFKGKIVVGTLCRLYKWKGIENVVKAYLKLPLEIKKKTVLLIVGGGEDFQKLNTLTKNQLNIGIYFYGNVEFNRAIRFLKTFDIFIHSSYPGGGLSNSLLQAMYCKNAIIASPNEGANEIIDDKNGILMKGNSSNEISRNIVKLVNNSKLRDKLSTNAKENIVKNFNWEITVKKYDKLFEEILK